MKKFALLFIAISLAMFSCRKDSEETTVISETFQPPVIKVLGSVAGLVTDENDAAMVGVLVSYANLSTLTDEKGLFLFEDVTLNAGGSYFKAETEGYFPGSTRIFPQANSNNFTRIKLLEKTQAGTLDSQTGGTVTFDGSAQIKFVANSFSTASGQPYTGTVNVAARWIDPTGGDLYEVMPGNLQGANEKNEEVALATFGMMAVAMTGANGEALQLAEGFTSELSFPVPVELQGSAPTEIPLWHFDEGIGIWVEEGKAILQDNRYLGQVSHFSFWNCDVPYPLVNLSGRVVNENGDPLPSILVQVTVSGNGNTAGAYTDGNGIFSGKVPKEEPLTLTVLDPCGEPAFTTDLGALSSDTDLGDIVVNDGETISINGTLVDCDNNPIEGFVEIGAGNSSTIVYTGEEGTFSLALLTCGESTIALTGYDPINLRYGNAATFTVADPLNVGNISACENTVDEYILITLLGETRLYGDPQGYYNPSGRTTLVFESQDSLSNGYIQLEFTGNTSGTYSAPDATFNFSEMFNGVFTSAYCNNQQGPNCDNFEITVTQYGAVGDKIIGTFNGNIDFTQNNVILPNVEFTGNFAVDRDQ